MDFDFDFDFEMDYEPDPDVSYMEERIDRFEREYGYIPDLDTLDFEEEYGYIPDLDDDRDVAALMILRYQGE